MPPDEITVERGIPVTTVARTLLDLGAVLRPEQLERALREADYLRLDDVVGLDVLLDRYPRRPGTRVARKARQDVRRMAGRTRSDLEDGFKALLSKADLPAPEVNATIELPTRTIEGDFVWRAQRLIVELDSHQAHGTRAAFEADRARDRAAAVAGWRVIRVTWRHLDDDRDQLTADLRRLVTQ